MTARAQILRAVRPSVLRPVNPAVALCLALGAVLVGYGYGLGASGRALGPMAVVREWVARPLGIGEDFGAVGLMLLLAATGYALASGARVLVLGVPFLAATVIGFAAAGVGGWPGTGSPDPLDVMTELAARGPGPAMLVPLCWPVALAFAARGAVAVSGRLPVGWRAAWIAGQLLIVAGVSAAGGLLGVIAVWYPSLVVGQLVHAARTREIGVPTAAVLGIGAYAVVVVADATVGPLHGWWYPLATVYAGLLFAVAVTFTGRAGAAVAEHPVVRWTASRAWCLAVLAVPVAHPVLATALPDPVAVPLALLATAAGAEAVYRLARAVDRQVTG